MNVSFLIEGSGERVTVPVDRPETLYGCTFLMLNSKEKSSGGKYAINPVNGERIPVFHGPKSSIGVPAHDQEAFEFAKKHNLHIRIVIEPITGKPQQNPEFRRSIVALVRDPKDGKILSINWGPATGGNLLVGGGLNEGEDPVECAKREITEETGYQDVKFLSKSETIHHYYFAHSRG